MAEEASTEELLNADVCLYSVYFCLADLVAPFTSYELLHSANLNWIENHIDGKYGWLGVSYGVRYYFYEEDDLAYFILGRYD